MDQQASPKNGAKTAQIGLLKENSDRSSPRPVADYPQMNFTQMHERLRVELLRRIERGTLSVSLLARQTGFGKSHLSNFLHSRRKLSLEGTRPDADYPAHGVRETCWNSALMPIGAAARKKSPARCRLSRTIPLSLSRISGRARCRRCCICPRVRCDRSNPKRWHRAARGSGLWPSASPIPTRCPWSHCFSGCPCGDRPALQCAGPLPRRKAQFVCGPRRSAPDAALCRLCRVAAGVTAFEYELPG